MENKEGKDRVEYSIISRSECSGKFFYEVKLYKKCE